MEKLRRNTKRAQKLNQQPKPDTAEFDLPPRAAGRRVRTGSAAHPQAAPPPVREIAPALPDPDEELDLTFSPPLAPAQPQPPLEAPPKVISLAQLHRQRSHRRLRRLALLTLAATAALVWLIGTYGDRLAALGDVIDSVAVAVDRSGSFPIKTGITEPKQLLSVGNAFVELGETDLLVYSGDGTQLRSIQPGYARAVVTAGNARFCVYNRAGTELRVESRTKNLYTFTAEDPILLCSMSQSGILAVVTKSTRYSASLRVYGTNMLERWSWTASDEEGVPISVEFASDNHRMAVSCLTAENGALRSHIYFLDTERDDIPAQYATEGTLVSARWLSRNRLLAVFEDRLELIDTAEGTLVGSRGFDNLTLQGLAESGSNTAVLLTSRAGSRILALDEELTPLCELELSEVVNGITLTRTALYTLSGNAVEAFDLTGAALWRNEFSAKVLAVMDQKHLLAFVGNTVQILQPPAQSTP